MFLHLFFKYNILLHAVLFSFHQLQQKGTSRSVKNATLDIPYKSDPWTDGKLKIGGPVYSGPLHNKKFCQKLMELLPTMPYITINPRIRSNS